MKLYLKSIEELFNLNENTLTNSKQSLALMLIFLPFINIQIEF